MKPAEINVRLTTKRQQVNVHFVRIYQFRSSQWEHESLRNGLFHAKNQKNLKF